jgi:hypothetical protein
MPRSWIGKNVKVKVTLIASLAFLLIIAMPTAMTTLVYAADMSADPVGNNPPPTDDQKPLDDNKSPPKDDI